MKSIAFAQRLIRDLKEKELAAFAADARLELLDAINGGLQRLHDLAPPHSKVASGSVALGAPLPVTLELTQGSSEFTGDILGDDDLYCTIRIEGDPVDNQVVGDGFLLHPYAGETGSRNAIIYHDAALIPEPYSEIISRPRILETRRLLDHDSNRNNWQQWDRCVTEPTKYWVEENAVNRNSPAPSILRVDSLPDRAYRLEMNVLIAPERVTFEDLLTATRNIPLREENIESYLLPIARGRLTHSELWRDKEQRQAVRDEAADAESRYLLLVPKTNATPANRVATPCGY